MRVNCIPRNVLLLQLGDIGDIVLTTPTIRAIKENYPEARISIMVRKPFGSLLLADPNLHEIAETTKIRGSALHILQEYGKLIHRLRRARYDLVIDLRTGDRGAILSFLTGAPVRIGISAGVKKQFWHEILFTKILQNLTVAPPPAHPGADQSLRIVRGIGINPTDTMPRLFVSPHNQAHAKMLLEECGLMPETSWVTINPFSRWKYKEWDNKKWGEVIDWLWESHRIPSVLIGSPEELSACQEIVAGREGSTINLAGKTSLGQLAAIISMSSLHVGVDSAAPHIAAALGTPTVTIHGPSDWRGWRIVDDMHKIAASALGCVPCNRRGCDNKESSLCLEHLETNAVIDVIEQVLQKLQQAAFSPFELSVDKVSEKQIKL